MSFGSMELIHFARTNRGLANQMARQPFFDAPCHARWLRKEPKRHDGRLGLHDLDDFVADNLI